mgnify:CR=1 FL=1
MFKELAPYLRQRAVSLTVTRLEDDQISWSKRTTKHSTRLRKVVWFLFA